MPACNNKPCTITKYYFNSYIVDSAKADDGSADLGKDQAKLDLERSESWRGRIGQVGFDPRVGESSPVTNENSYLFTTDICGCDDQCDCHMNSPFEPTINPERIEQTFEYSGVSSGGKTYTVTIRATCILWDYPGRCRPKVIRFSALDRGC